MMFYDFIRKVWGLVRNWSLLVYLGLLCCGKANRSAFHKPLEFTVWKISTSLSRHPFVKHVHSHLHSKGAMTTGHATTKQKRKTQRTKHCSAQFNLAWKKMLEFETKPEPTGTWVLHVPDTLLFFCKPAGMGPSHDFVFRPKPHICQSRSLCWTQCFLCLGLFGAECCRSLSSTHFKLADNPRNMFWYVLIKLSDKYGSLLQLLFQNWKLGTNVWCCLNDSFANTAEICIE